MNTVKEMLEFAGVDITKGKAKLLCEEEHQDYLFAVQWFESHSNIKQTVFDLIEANRPDKANEVIMKADPTLSDEQVEMLSDYAFYEVFS